MTDPFINYEIKFCLRVFEESMDIMKTRTPFLSEASFCGGNSAKATAGINFFKSQDSALWNCGSMGMALQIWLFDVLASIPSMVHSLIHVLPAQNAQQHCKDKYCSFGSVTATVTSLRCVYSAVLLCEALLCLVRICWIALLFN